MNKLKSLRTNIADIAADGVKLLDEQQLRLAVGARMNDGTCAPGRTYPSSYTIPASDTVTDDVYD